jgi:hypothetical protein
MWIGIIFETGSPTWKYRLLLNGTYSPSTDAGEQLVFGESGAGASSSEYGKYFDTGLNLIQSYVDTAILWREGVSADPNLTGYLRMPTSPKVGGKVPWIFAWLTGWCVNAGMMFYFNAMVGKMVIARDHQIERGLLLAGTSRAAD